MTAVSVVIPAFNNGPYIEEAIRSILRQTTLPDEIIVVDDGSTDGTEDVVRPFVSANLRYFRQTNQGVSAARNLGLEHCSGRYVTFLDADDRWRPHMLATQLELMESEAELVCCFGNFVRFEHGSGALMADQFQYFPELRTTASSPAGAGSGRVITGDAFPAVIGWSDFPAWLLTMLFRSSAIEGLRFDRRLIRCQDADFVLRAFMRGKVGFTSDVLAEVRRHGMNATSDVSMMALDKLKALECVNEDPRATQWSEALNGRLLRARFDAANACVRRGRWSEARHQLARALSSSGRLARKARGVARLGITAAKSLAAAR